MSDPIQTSAEALEAEALPRAYAVHTDPARWTGEEQPLPHDALRKPQARKSPAEWAYQRLTLYIRNFEKQLDAEHEVAMGFVGGAPGVMRIEGMGYFDPDIVTFYGTDTSGARTQIIQHVGQLNVLLRAVAKPAEREEPLRIGFHLASDLGAEPAPDDADAGPASGAG